MVIGVGVRLFKERRTDDLDSAPVLMNCGIPNIDPHYYYKTYIFTYSLELSHFTDSEIKKLCRMILRHRRRWAS